MLGRVEDQGIVDETIGYRLSFSSSCISGRGGYKRKGHAQPPNCRITRGIGNCHPLSSSGPHYGVFPEGSVHVFLIILRCC